MSALIESLSDAWRRVNLFLETRNWVAPSEKVLRELEKDGWRYVEDESPHAPVMFHAGPPLILHKIFTPEGTRALPGSPEMKRFDEAQAEAARKVYGKPAP
ncbi:MAG TPA: hypothetical protein VL625_11590 [Patescibacteria group bacterium]|nr:hypothetical protein [Patescibacteria group bacterium]